MRTALSALICQMTKNPGFPDHWNDNFNRATLGTNWIFTPGDAGASVIMNGSTAAIDLGTVNAYSSLDGVGSFDLTGKTLTVLFNPSPDNAVGFRDYGMQILTRSGSNGLQAFAGSGPWSVRTLTAGVPSSLHSSPTGGTLADNWVGLRFTLSGTTITFEQKSAGAGTWDTIWSTTIAFAMTSCYISIYNGRYGGSANTPHDNWVFDSTALT